MDKIPEEVQKSLEEKMREFQKELDLFFIGELGLPAREVLERFASIGQMIDYLIKIERFEDFLNQ